jgi:nicotinic acid mononucleotide adenylyltransferase
MRKLSRQVSRSGGVLYFVAGLDSLIDVKSWRESEKLLTAYNFVFVARPGVECADPRDVLPGKALSRLLDLTGLNIARARRAIAQESAAEGRIYIVDLGAPDISASRVRRRLRARRPVERMVPRSVRDYIRKFHLYGER